jgi:hypothetical protein
VRSNTHAAFIAGSRTDTDYDDAVNTRGRALTVAVLAAVGGLIAVATRRIRSERGHGGPGPPPSGVREPRRPLHPAGSGPVAAEPTDD